MKGNGHSGIKIFLFSGIGTIFILMYLDQTEYIPLHHYPRPDFTYVDEYDSSNFKVLPDLSKSTWFKRENNSIKIEDTKPDPGLLEESQRLKKIIIWHYGYDNKSMGFGFGRTPFIRSGCEESRCLLTDNRKLLPADEFDAIIFHFRGLERKMFPKIRSDKQRYIFFEMESASWIYHDPADFNGIFNWTMTYRKDSDIWSRYGSFYQRKTLTNGNEKFENLTKGKSKMAAWFVSNCHSMSWREKVVEDIRKWIPVDVYGECGPLKCTRKNEKQCYKMLERNYKFYLSFENSLCKDYATEKLYNILKLAVIPIVFGYADYESLAPPHSYINVLDFNDTRSLVDYLLYLDKNQTAYNEYFKWKEKYEVPHRQQIRNEDFCNLCKKLHTDREPKVYRNLTDWFLIQGKCKRLLPLTWMDVLSNFL